MREPVDSMPSTIRALTFSRARTSSASVAGSARKRSSSSPTTFIASTRLSGRVPTYRPTWPVSAYWPANE